MSYYINLSKITLEEYADKLETAYLAPSRMILKENTEERFEYFRQTGIKTVQDLLVELKNKKKFAEFQDSGFFPDEYLKILLRELKSILPKPVNISDFTTIKPETSEVLTKIGIKNTVKLYDRILNKEKRKALEEQTGLSKGEILTLTRLCDVSRIRWVGAAFAGMLYEIGVDTVEKISKCNPEELHERVNTNNHEKGIYKGKIGLNDIRIVVDLAKELSLDIEY
jgi:hypothetical protein